MLFRREQDICPCCGQRVLLRYGVKFPPKCADIFDMIERAGKVGIISDHLAVVFYAGRSIRTARNAIKCNIQHINSLLAGTDIEIWAGRGGGGPRPYRVRKRRKP